MELEAIQLCYTISKDVYTLAVSLDKRHRFGIGKRIEDDSRVLLSETLQTKYSSRPLKGQHLLRALVHLDILRYDLRTMLELGVGNATNIWKINEQIAEVGKMLGGWYKSVK